MSILGFIAEAVIRNVVVPAAAEKAYEATHRDFSDVENYFQKEPGTGLLVINQRLTGTINVLNVYDENRVVKYHIKDRRWDPTMQCLYVYDYYGNIIGAIKENLVSKHASISNEKDPVEYFIEISGQTLGRVKSVWSFGGKRKYEVDFYGWRLEGDVIGQQFKILYKTWLVADVSSKTNNASSACVVTFPDIRNELIVLMLVITLDAAARAR